LPMQQIDQTANVTLSDDQLAAEHLIKEWIANKKRKEFVLGGLAGTGKTTLIRHLVKNYEIGGVLALAGKAVKVLKDKGVNAQTIHSAIYEYAGLDDNGEPIFDTIAKNVFRKGMVVIVDESSMVNLQVANELRRHASKILWFGDHGQLEPIGDDPEIMTRCDYRLETIHRQAQESRILNVAYDIRTGLKSFTQMESGGEVVFSSQTNYEQIAEMQLDNDVVIVGFNDLRNRINLKAREIAKRAEKLCIGEQIICLKNNYRRGIYNGGIYTVTDIFKMNGDCIEANITDTDKEYYVQIYTPCLGVGKKSDDPNCAFDFFDYATAITCHKAQGSEWDRVLLVDPGDFSKWNMNRWRYTAVTRAKKLLHIVR